jgi:hypothetical protein
MKSASALLVLLTRPSASLPLGARPDRIGVIFMHGKQSTPQKTQGLGTITSALEGAGARS